MTVEKLRELRELLASANVLLTDLTDAEEHAIAEQMADVAAELRDRIRNTTNEEAHRG